MPRSVGAFRWQGDQYPDAACHSPTRIMYYAFVITRYGVGVSAFDDGVE